MRYRLLTGLEINRAMSVARGSTKSGMASSFSPSPETRIASGVTSTPDNRRRAVKGTTPLRRAISDTVTSLNAFILFERCATPFTKGGTLSQVLLW